MTAKSSRLPAASRSGKWTSLIIVANDDSRFAPGGDDAYYRNDPVKYDLAVSVHVHWYLYHARSGKTGKSCDFGPSVNGVIVRSTVDRCDRRHVPSRASLFRRGLGPWKTFRPSGKRRRAANQCRVSVDVPRQSHLSSSACRHWRAADGVTCACRRQISLAVGTENLYGRVERLIL